MILGTRAFAYRWILFFAILSNCYYSTRCQNPPTRVRPGPAYSQRNPGISSVSDRRQRMWTAQVDYALHRLDNDFGLLKSAMSNMERRLTMTVSTIIAERLESMVLITDGHETQIREAVQRVRNLESEVKILNSRETVQENAGTINGDDTLLGTSKSIKNIESELMTIGRQIEALNTTVLNHTDLLRTSLNLSEDHEMRLATIQTGPQVADDCEDIRKNLTQIQDVLTLQGEKIENISLFLETTSSVNGAGRINESSRDTMSYVGVADGDQLINFEIYDDYEDEENLDSNSSETGNDAMTRSGAEQTSVSDLSAKLETVFSHLLLQQNLLDNLTATQTSSTKRFHTFSKRFDNITAAFRRAQIRDAELNGGMRSNRRMLESLVKSFREIFHDDRRQKLAIVNLRRRIRNIEGIDFDSFIRRTEFDTFRIYLNQTQDDKVLGSDEVKAFILKEISSLAERVDENRDSVRILVNISRTLGYLETEIKSFYPDIQSISKLRDDVLGLINLRNLVLRNSGDVSTMHDAVHALRVLVADFKLNFLEMGAEVEAIKQSSVDTKENQEESHARIDDLDESLIEVRNQFTRFVYLFRANVTEVSEGVKELYSIQEGTNKELSEVKTKLNTVRFDLEDEKRTLEIDRASNEASQRQITNKFNSIEQSIRMLDDSATQMQTKTDDELYVLGVAKNEIEDSLREVKTHVADIQAAVANIKQEDSRQDSEAQSIKGRLKHLEDNVSRHGTTIEKTKDGLRRNEYTTTRLDERMLSLENQVNRFAYMEESWERTLSTQQNATIAVRKHVLQNYEELRTIDYMMKQVVSSVHQAAERYKSQQEEMRGLLSRSSNQSLSIRILRQRLHSEYADSNVTRQLFRKANELHRMINILKYDINVTSTVCQAQKSRFQNFEKYLSSIQSSIWKCDNENSQQSNTIQRIRVNLDASKETHRTFSENLQDLNGNILQMQQISSRHDTDIAVLSEAKQELLYDVRMLRNLAENAVNGTRETKTHLKNITPKIAELISQGRSLTSTLGTVKREVTMNTVGRQAHNSDIDDVKRRSLLVEGSLSGIRTRFNNLGNLKSDYSSLHGRLNRLSSLLSNLERASSDNGELSALYNELNSTVHRINRLQTSMYEENRKRFLRENEIISHVNEVKKGMSEVNSTTLFNEMRISGLREEVLSWREIIENFTATSQVFRRHIETSVANKLSKDEAKASIDALATDITKKEDERRELTTLVGANVESLSSYAEKLSSLFNALAAHDLAISKLSKNLSDVEDTRKGVVAEMAMMKTDAISVHELMAARLYSLQNNTHYLENRLDETENTYHVNLQEKASEFSAAVESKLEQMRSNFTRQLAESKNGHFDTMLRLQTLKKIFEYESSKRATFELYLEKNIRSIEMNHDNLKSGYIRLNSSNMALSENLEVQRIWSAAILRRLNLQANLHGEMLKEISYSNDTSVTDFISRRNDGTFYPQDVDSTSELFLRIICQYNDSEKRIGNLHDNLQNYHQEFFKHEKDVGLQISELNKAIENRSESLLTKLKSDFENQESMFSSLNNVNSILFKHAELLEDILENAKVVEKRSGLIAGNITVLNGRLTEIGGQSAGRIGDIQKIFDENITDITETLLQLRHFQQHDMTRFNDTLELLRYKIETSHSHSDMDTKVLFLKQNLRIVSDKLNSRSAEIDNLTKYVLELKNKSRGLSVANLGSLCENATDKVCEFAYKYGDTAERFLKHDDLLRYLLNNMIQTKTLKTEFSDLAVKALTDTARIGTLEENFESAKQDFDLLEKSVSDIWTNTSLANAKIEDQMNSLGQKFQIHSIIVKLVENRTLTNAAQLSETAARLLEVKISLSNTQNETCEINKYLADWSQRISTIESNKRGIEDVIAKNTERIVENSLKISTAELYVNGSNENMEALLDRLERDIKDEFQKIEEKILERIVAEKFLNQSMLNQYEKLSTVDRQIHLIKEHDDSILETLTRHELDISILRFFRVNVVKTIKNVTGLFNSGKLGHSMEPLGIGVMKQCFNSISKTRSALNIYMTDTQAELLTNNRSIAFLERTMHMAEETSRDHRTVLDQLVREDIYIRSDLENLSSSCSQVLNQQQNLERLKHDVFNKTATNSDGIKKIALTLVYLTKRSETFGDRLIAFEDVLAVLIKTSESSKNAVYKLQESSSASVLNYTTLKSMTSEIASNLSIVRANMRNLTGELQTQSQYYAESLEDADLNTKDLYENYIWPLFHNATSNSKSLKVITGELEDTKHFMTSMEFKKELLEETVTSIQIQEKRLDSVVSSVEIHGEQMRNHSQTIDETSENIDLSLNSLVERIVQIEIENFQQKSLSHRHDLLIQNQEIRVENITSGLEKVRKRTVALVEQDSFLESEAAIMNGSLSFLKKLMDRQNKELRSSRAEQGAILRLHSTEMKNLSIAIAEVGVHVVARTQKLDLVEGLMSNFTNDEQEIGNLHTTVSEIQENLSNLSTLVLNDIQRFNFGRAVLVTLNETIQRQLEHILQLMMGRESKRRDLHKNVSTTYTLLEKLLTLVSEVQSSQDIGLYNCRLENETAGELENQRLVLLSLSEKLLRQEMVQQKHNRSIGHMQDSWVENISLLTNEVNSLRNHAADNAITVERHGDLIQNHSLEITEAGMRLGDMKLSLSKLTLGVKNQTLAIETMSARSEAQIISHLDALNYMSTAIRNINRSSAARERRLDDVDIKSSVLTENIVGVEDNAQKLQDSAWELGSIVAGLLYNLSLLQTDVADMNKTARNHSDFQSLHVAALQTRMEQMSIENGKLIRNVTSPLFDGELEARIMKNTMLQIFSHNRKIDAFELRLAEQKSQHEEYRKLVGSFNNFKSNASRRFDEFCKRIALLQNKTVSYRLREKSKESSIQEQVSRNRKFEKSLDELVENLVHLQNEYSVMTKRTHNVSEYMEILNVTVEAMVLKLEYLSRGDASRAIRIKNLESSFINDRENVRAFNTTMTKRQDDLEGKLKQINETVVAKSAQCDRSLGEQENVVRILVMQTQENISSLRSSVDDLDDTFDKLKIDVEGNKSSATATNETRDEIMEILGSHLRGRKHIQDANVVLSNFEAHFARKFNSLTKKLYEVENVTAIVFQRSERFQNLVQDQSIHLKVVGENLEELQKQSSLVKFENGIMKSQVGNFSMSLSVLETNTTRLSDRISLLNESVVDKTTVLKSLNDKVLTISTRTWKNEDAIDELNMSISEMYRSLQFAGRLAQGAIDDLSLVRTDLNRSDAVLMGEIDSIKNSMLDLAQDCLHLPRQNSEATSSNRISLAKLFSSVKEIKSQSFQWYSNAVLFNTTVQQVANQMTRITGIELGMASLKTDQDKLFDGVERLRKSLDNTLWTAEMMKSDLNEVLNQTASCLAIRERHKTLSQDKIFQTRNNASLEAIKKTIADLTLGDALMGSEISNTTNLLRLLIVKLRNHSEAIQIISEENEMQREIYFAAVANLSNVVMDLSESGAAKWEHLGHMDNKYSLLTEKLSNNSNNIAVLQTANTGVRRNIQILQGETLSLLKAASDVKTAFVTEMSHKMFSELNHSLNAMETQTLQSIDDKEQRLHIAIESNSRSVTNLSTLVRDIIASQEHNVGNTNETVVQMSALKREIDGLATELQALQANQQEQYDNQHSDIQRLQNGTSVALEKLRLGNIDLMDKMRMYLSLNERQEERIGNLADESLESKNLFKNDLKRLSVRDGELTISILNCSASLSSLGEKFLNQSMITEITTNKFKKDLRGLVMEMQNLSNEIKKGETASSLMKRDADTVRRGLDFFSQTCLNTSSHFESLHETSKTVQQEFAVKLQHLNETSINLSRLYREALDKVKTKIKLELDHKENEIASISLELANLSNHTKMLTYQHNHDVRQMNDKVGQTKQIMSSYDERYKIVTIELRNWKQFTDVKFRALEQDILRFQNDSSSCIGIIAKHDNVIQEQILNIRKMKDSLGGVENKITHLELDDRKMKMSDKNSSKLLADLSSKMRIMTSHITILNESALASSGIVDKLLGQYLDVGRKAANNTQKIHHLTAETDELLQSLNDTKGLATANSHNLSLTQTKLNDLDRIMKVKIEKIADSLEHLKVSANHSITENRIGILSTSASLVLASDKFKYHTHRWNLITDALNGTVEHIVSQLPRISSLEQNEIEQQTKNEAVSVSFDRTVSLQDNILWNMDMMKDDLREVQNETSRCLAAKERHEDLLQTQSVQALKVTTSLEEMKEKISQLTLEDLEMETDISNTSNLLQMLITRLNNQSEAFRILGNQRETERTALANTMENMSNAITYLSESGAVRWEHIGYLDKRYSVLVEKKTNNSNAIAQIRLSTAKNGRGLSELRESVVALRRDFSHVEESLVITEQLIEKRTEDLSRSIVILENRTDKVREKDKGLVIGKIASNFQNLQNLENQLQKIKSNNELNAELHNYLNKVQTERIDMIAAEIVLHSRRLGGQFETILIQIASAENKTLNAVRSLEYEIERVGNKTSETTSENKRQEQVIREQRLLTEETARSLKNLDQKLLPMFLRVARLSTFFHNSSLLLVRLSQKIRNNTEAIKFFANNRVTEFSLNEDRISNMSNALEGIVMVLSSRGEQIERFRSELNILSETSSKYQQRMEKMEYVSGTMGENVTNIGESITRSKKELVYARRSINMLNGTVGKNADAQHESATNLENLLQHILFEISSNISLNLESLENLKADMHDIFNFVGKHGKQINETIGRVEHTDSRLEYIISGLKIKENQLKDVEDEITDLQHSVQTSDFNFMERLREIQNLTMLLQSTVVNHEYRIQQQQIAEFNMLSNLDESKDQLSFLTIQQASFLKKAENVSSYLTTFEKFIETQSEAMADLSIRHRSEITEIVTDIMSLTEREAARGEIIDDIAAELNFKFKTFSNNSKEIDEFRGLVARSLRELEDGYLSMTQKLRDLSATPKEKQTFALAQERNYENCAESIANITRQYHDLANIVVDNRLGLNACDEVTLRNSKTISAISDLQDKVTQEKLDLLIRVDQLRNSTSLHEISIKNLGNVIKELQHQGDKTSAQLKVVDRRSLDTEQKCSIAENRTTSNLLTVLEFSETLYELSQAGGKATESRVMLSDKIGNLSESFLSLRVQENTRALEVERLQENLEVAKKHMMMEISKRFEYINSSWFEAFENLKAGHLDANSKYDALKKELGNYAKSSKLSLQNLTNILNTLPISDQETNIDAIDARAALQEARLEETSGKIKILSSFRESIARTVSILGNRIVQFQNDTSNVLLRVQRHDDQIREQNLRSLEMNTHFDNLKRKLTLLIEFHHGDMNSLGFNSENSPRDNYGTLVAMMSTVYEDVASLNVTAWRVFHKSQSNPLPVYDGLEFEDYDNDQFGGDSISKNYIEQYTDDALPSALPGADLLSNFTKVIEGIENVLLFAVPKTTELFKNLKNHQNSIEEHILTLNQELQDVKKVQNTLDFAVLKSHLAAKEHIHKETLDLISVCNTSMEDTNRNIRSLRKDLGRKIELVNMTIVSESQRSALLLEQILPFMEVEQQNAGTVMHQLNASVEQLRQSYEKEVLRNNLIVDDVLTLQNDVQLSKERLTEIQNEIEEISESSSESAMFNKNRLMSSVNATLGTIEIELELLKRGGERRDTLLVNAENTSRRQTADITSLKKITENTNVMLNAIVEENKWNGNQIDTCIQNIETLNSEYALYVSSFQVALSNHSSRFENLNTTVNELGVAITNLRTQSPRPSPTERTGSETHESTAVHPTILSASNFNTVVANPTSIVVSWTASPSPGVTRYRLFIREALDSELLSPVLVEVSDTQVLVDGLTPDTAYLIEIFTVVTDGNLSRDPLTGMSVTAQKTTSITTSQPTHAQGPTNITPTEAEDSSQIMWQCDFETLCDILQSTSDDFDWIISNGSTPSEDTGPSTDHTQGDIQGRYMYIEASRPRQSGDIARISTPLQSSVDDACLEFYYHMFGVGAGDLSVVLSTDSGRENRLWEQSGSQENLWQKQTMEFHSDERFRLIFEAVRGSDYHGDLALDDIAVKRGRCPRPVFECDFEEVSICGFTQDSNDDFDWDRNNGATSSSDTGPMMDHTSATLDGYYMYMESSNPRVVNEGTRLVGPELSSSRAQCLQFFYHLNGVDINTLNVYAKLTEGGMNKLLWSKVGPQGNDWNVARVEITSTSSYHLVFEAIRGNDFHGDIAIDDITVNEGKCSNRACAIGSPFGDLCYEVNNLHKQYVQASTICNTNGGQLAVIKTSAQQDFVKDLITKNSDKWSKFWIGLDDLRREGHLAYSDGTPLASGRNSFNAWASNEPSDVDGTKDCVAIDIAFKNRRWSELACDLEIGFVCQYSLSP